MLTKSSLGSSSYGRERDETLLGSLDIGVSSGAVRTRGATMLSWSHTYIKAAKSAMSGHVCSKHLWAFKPCEYGCGPNHIYYYTGGSYRTHVYSRHSPCWPTRCRVTGCTSQEEFKYYGTLNYHLIHDRKSNDDKKRAKCYPPSTEKFFLAQGYVLDDYHPKDRYGATKVFTKPNRSSDRLCRGKVSCEV